MTTRLSSRRGEGAAAQAAVLGDRAKVSCRPEKHLPVSDKIAHIRRQIGKNTDYLFLDQFKFAAFKARISAFRSNNRTNNLSCIVQILQFLKF